MIEVKGDLFTWLPPGAVSVLRVITTNGTVKANGEAVMGRGCALEAKTKWPDLPKLLGQQLSNRGLQTHLLHTVSPTADYKQREKGIRLVCFPVKYHWMQPASLALIKESMTQLALHRLAWTRYYAGGDNHRGLIVMPRPGCGNGRLSWKDVQPVLLEGIKEGEKQRGHDYQDTGGEWLYIISPEDK